MPPAAECAAAAATAAEAAAVEVTMLLEENSPTEVTACRSCKSGV